MSNINLLNIDCYEYIKTIPDKSVDLIYTDPPYEIETKGGLKNNLGKSLRGAMANLEDTNLNIGINPKILNEFIRINKKINIYIWCNIKQIPIYLDFFANKNKCNFDILIWAKTNALPLFNNKYLTDKEYCLYFRKGGYCNPPNYDSAKTVFDSPINSTDKKLFGHPTIKPLEFVKNHIYNSTKENDLVFDPFSGSGTTAVACKELNRNFIGCEINKDYYNKAIDRINGLTLSDRAKKDLGFQSLFDMEVKID